MDSLVLGGAGFLGLHAVQALVEDGHEVTAGHRKRTNTMVLRRRGVSRCLADLDDPESLRQAMVGRDVVVHAAGHYPRFSIDHSAVLECGLRQSQNVLDAAVQSGVRRLVYLSSTATVSSSVSGPSNESDVYLQVPSFGLYHQLKWQMERLFLAESRLEVVVLCPGACLGAWDLRVGTSALLVATARGMRPYHPNGIVNIVDAGDVGVAVAGVSTVSDPPKRILLSGTNCDLHSLLEGLSKRYQVAAPRPPLSAAEATRHADEAELEAANNGGRPELVREIVDLVNHGVAIDASLAVRCLNIQWTPLSQTLDTFDAFARRLNFIPDLTPDANNVNALGANN